MYNALTNKLFLNILWYIIYNLPNYSSIDTTIYEVITYHNILSYISTYCFREKLN